MYLYEQGKVDLAIEYAKQAVKNSPLAEAGLFNVRLGNYYVAKRSGKCLLSGRYLILSGNFFRFVQQLFEIGL